MVSRFRPTSKTQLMKIMDNKMKILNYPDLKNYKNVNDLLNPYGGCIILYETTKNNGHWVLLYEHKGTINFFDSYGFKYPNDEMNFINPEFQHKNEMDKMLLYNLIFQYPVEHNDIQYQSFSPLIKSCGLWCCSRYILKDLSPKQFQKYFLTGVRDPDKMAEDFVNLYLTSKK